MAGENAARLTVHIDPDTARPAIVEGLLAEVAKYGTAHVKRLQRLDRHKRPVEVLGLIKGVHLYELSYHQTAENESG